MNTTTTPTLIYLHGVGDGDPDDGWREALDRSLRSIGYSGLDGVDIVAPKYPQTLFDHPNDDDPVEVPAPTEFKLDKQRRQAVRRDLERQTARLESLLGAPATGAYNSAARAVVPSALIKVKAQAWRYLDNKKQSRARVLRRILDAVPQAGEVVLIGHSLGSVVALDLCRRLPRDVTVRSIITIGSPAGHGGFHRFSDRLDVRSAPPNVRAAVNLWSHHDPITFFCGIAHHFPWVLDARVDVNGHRSAKYMADETVATAVGDALFGSRSKELVLAASSTDVPLSVEQAALLVGDAYGGFVLDELEGDKGERFGGALAVTQSARAVELLRSYGAGTTVATSFGDHLVSCAEFTSEPHRPVVPRHLDAEEASLLLLWVVQQNPVAPYEIEVPDQVQRRAAENLAAAMGHSALVGRRAFEAWRFAESRLRPRRSFGRWIVVGGGLAALVAATGGLALAAAPGVAGAAAMTSALAAFGPGGMMGGLLTAGALTSGGVGAIAGALARNASVEEVESVIASQVAIFRIRHELGLDQRTDAWLVLRELHHELVRDRVSQDIFSDNGSPTLKANARKLKATETAMECIREHGWLPEIDGDADETTEPV